MAYDSPTHASASVSADVLKKMMLRDPGTADRASSRLVANNFLSMYDLLTYVANGEDFQLFPRYNRFEAYLLPTHEVSAFFGSTYTLRSVGQIEALKSDAEYMRSHAQVIALLLTIWEGAWENDAWLLRHALLSAILLDNTESMKNLVAFAKSQSQAKQVNMGEDGFGEALFTLSNDETMAKAFWNQPTRRSGIRSPHLPGQRMSLGQLVRFTQP
jgi:hypothetical protein